jgi:5-methylcytosine-specific restriction endonuclease McrA
MERPSVPAMDEIEAVLKDIEDMEHAIMILKERLFELPAQVGSQLETSEERLNAAQYLYWMFPRLSAKAIASGLLGVNVYRFQTYIRSVESSVKCERCKNPIHFQNRSHMQEICKAAVSFCPKYNEGYRILCETCWKELSEESERMYERYEISRRSSMQVLKTMVYSEYLKTPHWQERRKKHLKSTGFRCQVCNASNVTLDVHHRTYERRGQEHYTDLLSLCRSCHDLFHSVGRLIKQ